MIIISYIIYVRKNPEEHKRNKFKLLGGKAMAYVILAFFLFVFVLLFFSADTRVAIFISPVWFIFLFLFYKKSSATSRINQSLDILLSGTEFSFAFLCLKNDIY